MKKHVSVDILVNNAGIYPYADLMHETEEHYNKVFDINVKVQPSFDPRSYRFLGCYVHDQGGG